MTSNLSKRRPSQSSKEPATRVVLGQSSWRIASDEVEALVTQTGGHLGPVTFYRSGRKLRPYSVAPWAEEASSTKMPAIIKALRGDFFCLPFGGNDTRFKGEKHPVHGETANSKWKFRWMGTQDDETRLHLSLRTRIRPGCVDKKITLVRGQNALYSEHIISGMRGPMGIGHHAMLKFPDAPGSGIISTSRIVYGQVFPGDFESPENGGYSSLKPGAEFDSLEKVPMLNGGIADVTRFPARRGFEDLVLVVSDPDQPFAWTVVTFPKERYLWFALKDPRVLRQTVLWISNGGRHYPPWNGRHVGVMGLEDVTANFHYGLAESAGKNPLAKKGFVTCVNLDPERPLSVRYIMGITAIPAGFDRVVSIEATDDGNAITLHSASDKRAAARVNLGHLGSR